MKYTLENYQELVGQYYVDGDSQCPPPSQNKLKSSTDVQVKAFTRDQLPAKTRLLKPDQVWTMDFQEDRLSIYLDDECKVTKVKIG